MKNRKTKLTALLLALVLLLSVLPTFAVAGNGSAPLLPGHGESGNPNAALMAGINVQRIKIIARVLAGLFAAIGGIFDVLDAATANSAFGSGREFRTIICVNIGGITAGSGSVLGVGLGVLLFHVLWYALRILDVDTNLQLVLIGAILVMAVLLDILRTKYEARRIAR